MKIKFPKFPKMPDFPEMPEMEFPDLITNHQGNEIIQLLKDVNKKLDRLIDSQPEC